MTFGESISTCFSKYADFTGRASRAEYWWWVLFTVLVAIATGIVSDKLSPLFSLATLLPSLAVGARRLHDVVRFSRSGRRGGRALHRWALEESFVPDDFFRRRDD